MPRATFTFTVREFMNYHELIAGFIAGVLLAVITTPHCRADELYVVASVKSYHFDRAAHYNENNLGVGFEYHPFVDGKDTGIRIGGGEYKNSLSVHTNYIEAAYLPIKFTDWIRGGLDALIVTGYETITKWFPVVLPVIEVKVGNYGANIVVAPLKKGGVALQVKYRF
jgi:hypothetical protein